LTRFLEKNPFEQSGEVIAEIDEYKKYLEDENLIQDLTKLLPDINGEKEGNE